MRKSQRDFKWFGEGFDGFPRILPEDCVDYTIYIIDSRLDDLEKRSKLREVQSTGQKLVSDLTKGFIWQREGIQFDLERDKTQSFLHGRTNYGDSVEDEWLVVYILRELSKRFTETWIRVVDTDGQFLLIEAAAALPHWVNPDVAEFRAWLNKGDLLIIPLDESRAKEIQGGTSSLTLDESLTFLSSHRSGLINSPEIQAEAFYRLHNYPQQIWDSLHHAVVRIPRRLACVLHDNPAYISPAVEAFYLRDPIALRPLRTQGPDELVFAPRDLVRVSTKFTKVGYAQLKSQQFDPPKTWKEALRPNSDPKFQLEAEMGMKLSCGFEMLLRDPQNQDNKAVREINLILDDLDVDADLLPSDADISKWCLRQDDEKWLDINFENFDKELSGRKEGAAGVNGGFGDKRTEDNLRKMVARFEEFLNGDATGAEAAEYLDDMDNDDDDDRDSTISEGSNDDGEEKDISFDEVEFRGMMREVMGMSSQTANTEYDPSEIDHSNRKRLSNVPSDEDAEALRHDTQTMENELREAGALDLDPRRGCDVSKPLPKGIVDTRSSGTIQNRILLAGEKDERNEDVDTDCNLAKELLGISDSQDSGLGPEPNTRHC